MIPLFKKVKTQAEKDALIRQARATYDAIPDEHKHIFAASDEDYLSCVADNIEVEMPVYSQPRELTASELTKQNGELINMHVFGDRCASGSTGIPAIDEMVEKRERQEFEKLVGPARRSETWLENLVREALNKAQSVPRRESEREPLALAKRASSGVERIEYDARIGESTLYAASGALLGSWHGAPTDRPGAAA
jgi:hypothetical protein